MYVPQAGCIYALPALYFNFQQTCVTGARAGPAPVVMLTVALSFIHMQFTKGLLIVYAPGIGTCRTYM